MERKLALREKSVRIRSFVARTDQKNSEYAHFSRSVNYKILIFETNDF